jgi:2-isopropylmalate synthase
MMLTDVRVEVVGGRSGTRAPIRVRITGSSPNGGPWTKVGSSADILHACWLALTDSVEYALLVREREVACS